LLSTALISTREISFGASMVEPVKLAAPGETTRQLAAALGTINVVLHDHIIVGRNRETSLRKMNLI
jgi:DNA repair protein RadC